MRRIVVQGIAAFLLLIAVALLGGYLYLLRSLPATRGTFEVGGVAGTIEIVRDADTIPHIFASTRLDALYGLGFVHAQDRLWQMEFQRRIGHGRLSEVFGDATLKEDRFLRTVGFGRAARAAWDRLPADARGQIEAYVGGVNAFIASHRGSRLPPEFSLLGFEPEPWSGPDVLAWVKMMAWDLSANYSLELLRRDVAARVGLEGARELLPLYPADGLNILSTISPDLKVGPTRDRQTTAGSIVGPTFTSGDTYSISPTFRSVRPTFTSVRPTFTSVGPTFTSVGPTFTSVGPTFRSGETYTDTAVSYTNALTRSLSATSPTLRRLLLGGGGATEGLGSNNWVVDGTMTASGKPLLANDPHLGTQVPSLWYLAHMSAGDFDVIGATLPGAPAVAIGRNRFIAWGETNMFADVEDLYHERLDPSGRSAEFKGAMEPLRIVAETIKVKGREHVRVDVRMSRHGPLVSDAINANNGVSPEARTAVEPLALRWTALDEDDRTIVAFLRLNDARSWTGFTAALREFVVPSQNFVYADIDGHIGYYAPGHVPIRATGDGLMPAEGWTGDMEWTGWIPFDELPHTYDPPSHFIVTANNRPVPPDYKYALAFDYHEPFRAQRITDILRQKARLTPDDFRTIQSDTFSLHAQTLLPLLLEHVRPESGPDRQAIDLLRRWNLNATSDSAAAAIFEAWFLRLAPQIVEDELGLMVAYERRFTFVTRFVSNLLKKGSSRFCGHGTQRRNSTDLNVGPAGGSCDERVTAALHQGVAMLTERLGPDMRRWRWDAAHRAVFPHQGFDTVPGLHWLLSRSMASHGDWSSVNVGAVDVTRPFDQTEIPGYRQIIDLSPVNDNRYLGSVGQVGHFLSPHYDDELQNWGDVRHVPMRMDRATIEKGATGHLRLVPKPVS